jgi:hypothetical protein
MSQPSAQGQALSPIPQEVITSISQQTDSMLGTAVCGLSVGRILALTLEWPLHVQHCSTGILRCLKLVMLLLSAPTETYVLRSNQMARRKLHTAKDRGPYDFDIDLLYFLVGK